MERREELLRILYERSMNKVFELSADYTMKTPKKGCEEEFKTEREIVGLIEELQA